MSTTRRPLRHLPRLLAAAGVLLVSGCGGGGGSSGGGGSMAGTALLSWTAPTTNSDGSALTDLKGYHIYYGSSADLLTVQIDVNSASTTSYTVTNLTPGTWYFAVTAFNSAGLESNLSNTASKMVN